MAITLRSSCSSICLVSFLCSLLSSFLPPDPRFPTPANPSFFLVFGSLCQLEPWPYTTPSLSVPVSQLVLSPPLGPPPPTPGPDLCSSSVPQGHLLENAGDSWLPHPGELHYDFPSLLSSASCHSCPPPPYTSNTFLWEVFGGISKCCTDH